MRIAFVTEVWHPSINGVVTRLSVTVDELLGAGHEVLIVTPKLGDAAGPVEGTGSHTRRGLTVRTVPSFRIKFVYGGQPWGLPLPVVSKHLREFRPDLVHVINPFMIGIAGVIASRRHRWPLVASFHTDIAAYARFYHLGWIRPIIWLLIRLLHNAAALNLVTSSYSARLLASHGIGRIKLWRRGVDLELFRPRQQVSAESADSAEPPGSSGSPGSSASLHSSHPQNPGAETTPVEEVHTALYVGRLAYEKGLHRLLPLAKDPGIRVVMVGDGPDHDRLEKEFEGTGTVFTGSLTGEDLSQTYADADVFVFASTTETLGLVILEALASGVPVVAAESPASHELLASSPAARLFPADHSDAAPGLVREILASAPRDSLSAAARAEAEGWSWALATEELLGYYADVLSELAEPLEEPSPRLPGSELTRP